MAAGNKVIITITDDGSNKKYARDTNVSDKATKNLVKSAAKLVGTLVALEGARKGLGLAETAARADDAAKSFANLSKNAGFVAEEMLASMKKATAGTISEFELMKQFSSAALLGLPLDEFDDMLAIARSASKATGATMEFMLNSIVTGIGRSSKLMIDNLGILVSIGDANKVYAEALEKTSSSLTDLEQKQAFSNAVILAGQKNIEKTGEILDSDADKFARYAAEVENLGILFGDILRPNAADAAAELANVLDAIDAEDIKASAAAISIMAASMGLYAVATAGAAASTIALVNALRVSGLGAILVVIGVGFQLVIDKLDVFKTEAEELIPTIDKLSKSVDKLFEDQHIKEQAEADAEALRLFNEQMAEVTETAKRLQNARDALGDDPDLPMEVPENLLEDINELEGGLISVVEVLPLIADGTDTAVTSLEALGAKINENADIINASAQLVGDIGSVIANNRIDDINRVQEAATTAATETAKDEIKAAKDSADAARKANEASTASDKIKADNEKAINANLANQLVAINATKETAITSAKDKARDDENDARRAQKPFLIAEAIANTAVAVIKALPNIPLSILIGSIGAVEVGKIASQQFADGTLNAPGGRATVGERGPEQVVLPQGAQVIPTDQAAPAMPNFTIMIGGEVVARVTNAELERMVDLGQSNLMIQA